MEKIDALKEVKNCPIQYVLSINDTLNVISGKWKLPILGSILFGKKRFTDIQRNIPKITPRMLSKELKELELNGMLVRTVHDSTPVMVEYSLTDSGQSITEVLDKMVEWGIQHRKAVITG
ncbi:winged helix-turn-helix transcriptional regulator [Arthrospiribacter ruber]|uniref:Transcriptional regulator n=1 Tax=Arthrospiribacter ruber TaxID=2487934 RepID=A0A951J2A3_9BACT|nr:helix-turn-helix domain-containing protein [Arthrospiribacter ruber]MBW3470459.1 transcriptional regulator [Arthrospiribacter ruber]